MWETTNNYVRSGHGDMNNYSTCKTTTFDDKLPRGIKAIYCQRKDGKGWETQSYLFPLSEGWTESEAKNWFKSNNKNINKQVAEYLVRDLIKSGEVPALIVKSPYGKMARESIISLIVKTKSYSKNIGIPVALAEDDGKIYALVTLNQPVILNKKQFDILIDKHNITEEETFKWAKVDKNWNGNVLYGYPFKIIKEFKIPIEFYIPPDTEDWVEGVNVMKMKIEEIDSKVLEKNSNGELQDIHEKMHDLWGLLKKISVTEKRINTASLIVNKHALIRNLLEHKDIIHKRLDSLDDIKTNESEGTIRKNHEFNRYVPICKIDLEKQIVYGEVLVPDAVDAQGHKITAEEIEKACHWYMENSQKNKVMHKGDYIDSAVVENYIVPQNLEFINPKGEKVIVTKGTWMMGTKIYNNDIWKQVKAGELTGYSIGGTGFLDEIGEE
jgi:hypothetical protein